jgi:NADH-quinone oxidoreductase subunit A
LDSSAENTVLLWPLLAYGAFVFILVGAILGLSFFLGQRHSEHATNEPYESGILSTGWQTWQRTSQHQDGEKNLTHRIFL